jgi:hypothetical protein
MYEYFGTAYIIYAKHSVLDGAVRRCDLIR